MCVSQRWWRVSRGQCSRALLLLLSILSTPGLSQGALQIPKDYQISENLVSEPPLLFQTPYSFTAFTQEDINLPCMATGKPTPTFRWVKDGEELNLNLTGNGTLKADKNDTLDLYQGSYRCYASNELGTAVSKTVYVTVENVPTLVKQQKKHENAYEGHSLVLSCNPPESSTPPHIHWMDMKMVHIKLSERVMAGLDGNLYFSNLLKSDSRTDYFCNAQYAAAMTVLPETKVTLTVLPSNSVHGRRPELFTPSGSHSSVLALRGNSLTLECIPKGLPTPKVEWTKKDGRLEETGGVSESHGRRLHFDFVTQTDDGEYECRAFNEHGSTTHAFTVTVEAAPYWVKEPQSLMYSPRESVRLDCQAEGVPTPSISWSINGELLTDVDSDPRRSVSGGVLKLMDVEVTDTAVYQCEASNKHGSILLNTFINVVELPPQILTPAGLVYRVTEGGDITLHCQSFGSPQPHVTWADQQMSPLLSHPRASLLTNGTIEIFNVTQSDRGTYSCSIEDTNLTISAHLEVYARTVILTGPQSVRVLRGSWTLLDCEASIDPDLSHDHQVVWRKDGLKIQESPADDKFTMFENGTLRVSGVQSDDSGVYTCEVITSLDHVQSSSSITVVAPPDPPLDLTLTEEDRTLTLSWTPGHAHNSPITEYMVEAREEQHSEEAGWRWEEYRTVPGDVTEIELILQPYCTYRFRITAVNDVGRSQASQHSQHYSTPPAIPTINPSGVRSDTSDPGSLTITWDEMDKRQHNGHGFQYHVFWREAGGRGVHWNSGYAKSPPFIVNNTETYAPFEIKVQAVNSLGEAPPADPEIGHSGEDLPLQAPSGVAVEVKNSTVKVKWTEAKQVRGLLLGYKIYIKRLGPKVARRRRSLGEVYLAEEPVDPRREEEEEEEEIEVEVQGMKTSQEISGLKLFSLYELSVTAFNSKGQGPRSPPYRFETPEGAPGPPAALTLESPSDSSVVLLWSPPTETNGLLLGYTVQYQQELDSEVKLQIISDPSTTHIELSPLNSSSYYIFKVMARTAAGDGPPITRRGATLLHGAPPSNITMFFGDTYVNLSWVPGERDRNHGFHIDYLRKSAGGSWQQSEVVNSTQGFYTLSGLHPGTTYHLLITHLNDTVWEQLVQTKGPELSEMPGGFATQGWFIGLISAICLLVLILLIICLIKRRKGGKYAVKDKEDKEVDSEARPMKDETFGEYRSLESDADEKRSDSQPSLCDSKMGSDDSLAEYGDSVDIQFNEDGSFIGQYSGRCPVPHGNESSGPASPVNTAPHPPIAPSALARPS